MERIIKNAESENGILIPPGYIKFVNICRKLGFVEKIESWKRYGQRHYRKTEGYSVSKKTFKAAVIEFNEIRDKYREKWENYPKIFKLVDILRKSWKSNKGAKNVYSRNTRSRLYGRKERFIWRAIELAKEINLPFFSWGCNMDYSCVNYNVVLYFQIGDEQVSFHTDYLDNVPEFQGEWIGFEQYTFPLSITKVKKIAKKYGIKAKDIKKVETTPFEKEPVYKTWESDKVDNYDNFSFYYDDGFY